MATLTPARRARVEARAAKLIVEEIASHDLHKVKQTTKQQLARMDILPLRPADHAAWLPLWRGYQAFYKIDIPDDVGAVTWTRLLDPAEPMGGALAWDGCRAIGLVHHVRHRSTWTIGDYVYLQDLFVDPATRGKGVGRALIEHVYALATAAGCSRVHWLTHETNSEAMTLYDRIARRSGFVQYRKLLD